MGLLLLLAGFVLAAAAAGAWLADQPWARRWLDRIMPEDR